jgi:radical SAM superfamily enzyme YgiQ (UPF0313 family)
VFEETADFVDRIGVDVAHFSILTPYPGTHTFSRMMADGRITSFDWKRYTLYNAVFTPAQMSATELEEGTRLAYRRFYRARPRLPRFSHEISRRAPRFGTALAVAGQNYATHYRDPRASRGPRLRGQARGPGSPRPGQRRSRPGEPGRGLRRPAS